MGFLKRMFSGGSHVEGAPIDDAGLSDTEMSEIAAVTGKNSTWLNSIWVNPHDRGKGYGKTMLTEFENDAKNNGSNQIIGELTPESESQRENLRNWYLENGYEIKIIDGREYVLKEL